MNGQEEALGTIVELYVYDLTRGLSRMMSAQFLGKHLDGIWHTGIVAYGREYFFGGEGLKSCSPGGTVLGTPDRVVKLGESCIPYQLFLEYILGLGESTFSPGTYNLLQHNCNNFSNEVSQFLCGTSIPKYILDLPEEFFSSPLGLTLRPLIESLSLVGQGSSGGVAFGQFVPERLQQTAPRVTAQREDSPDLLELNTAIEEVRRNSVALEERRNAINEKLVRKEKKKGRKKKGEGGGEGESKRKGSIGSARSEKHLNSCSSTSSNHNLTSQGSSSKRRSSMAEMEGVGNGLAEGQSEGENGAKTEKKGKGAEEMAAEMEEEERKEREAAKKKQRDPPIVFRDAVDVRVEFDALVGYVENILNPEEQQSLEELHQYMLEDEGSWALSDSFLIFVGRLLHDTSLATEARLCILKVLAVAALKDDVILLLHQDRREHVLMNYAHTVDRLPHDEQLALTLFVANLFENLSSSEWLLYISEWDFHGQMISNIRVTTKVAVNALLSQDETLRDRGSAIIHNLACKEVKTVVFDDVAVELTMALLQFFSLDVRTEELLFRCFKALHRFCQISQQDVPQLIQMIGPPPSQFKGASERVDTLIAEIERKLR